MAPTLPPVPEPQQFEHPAAGHARKKKRQGPYILVPIKAFYIFLAASVLAALFSPIQDCDETFNYWEPTHYLSHGYGLQTWEYSPEYAIRSWLYVGLHAIIGNVRRLLPQPTKVAEFYFIRYILALFFAISQTVFYQSITLTLNGRVGLFFILATVVSPGNFHASAAYLPSSFAMCAGMLGAAAFMNWRGGVRTAQGIFWFAVAGILGWPFAAALSFPFVFEDAIIACFSGKAALVQSFGRISRGVASGVLVVLLDLGVNLFFYKKVELVSWNIIKYNILSSTGGPDLYGTEPWSFYVKNLTLNFNLWFLLALLSLPLYLAQKAFSKSNQNFQTGLRTLVFLTPFYMWLAIFTMQPHKEERFMYPVYPFLALNASMALHIILSALGTTDPKTLAGKLPPQLKLLVVATVLSIAINISASRIYGVWSAYSAPLAIYSPLQRISSLHEDIGNAGDTVCFGKEWYRFPTSYFLPRDMHAKFVRSEFRGLLPGEFLEQQTGSGFRSGTWTLGDGFNDRNEEDLGKYVALDKCSFLVDTQYSMRDDPLPPNEPDYIADGDQWEVIKCKKFLDAGKTHIIGRTLWVPDLAIVPQQLHRKWGRHCLLRRRKS